MKRVTLRYARQRAGLTQEQLAAASGVEQATVSKLETGRVSNPNFDTVLKLAKALGIAPDHLHFVASPDRASA